MLRFEARDMVTWGRPVISINKAPELCGIHGDMPVVRFEDGIVTTLGRIMAPAKWGMRLQCPNVVRKLIRDQGDGDTNADLSALIAHAVRTHVLIAQATVTAQPNEASSLLLDSVLSGGIWLVTTGRIPPARSLSLG